MIDATKTDEAKKDEAKSQRTLTGRVVSDKMDKTVSVAVERLIKHPTYGKYIRRSTKIMAHDESNDCREGDLVAISERRRVSKRKAWQVVNVIERAADREATTV